MSAIDFLLQEPMVEAVGWALLQFVWQGALIGVLTAAALWILRRSAADVRYVVAAIGLSLMLTMPVMTAVQAWRTLDESRVPSIGSRMRNNCVGRKGRLCWIIRGAKSSRRKEPVGV